MQTRKALTDGERRSILWRLDGATVKSAQCCIHYRRQFTGLQDRQQHSKLPKNSSDSSSLLSSLLEYSCCTWNHTQNEKMKFCGDTSDEMIDIFCQKNSAKRRWCVIYIASKKVYTSTQDAAPMLSSDLFKINHNRTFRPKISGNFFSKIILVHC